MNLRIHPPPYYHGYLHGILFAGVLRGKRAGAAEPEDRQAGAEVEWSGSVSRVL